MNNAFFFSNFSGLGFRNVLKDTGQDPTFRPSIDRVLETGFWRKRPEGVASVTPLLGHLGSQSSSLASSTPTPR